MASLGFVRNNPWVQQDKMRRDSQSEASNSACRPNGVVYASQSLTSSAPKSLPIRQDDEEPEYGPGIVRLLRDKFLQMAAEAEREAEAGRWKHSKARKAVSCESLLDGPVSLIASISQPAPTDLPASKYKLCGSTNALADVGLQAEEEEKEEEGPPTPRAPSPMAPEEPVAAIKARFEAAQSVPASPSPKKPLPKKTTMETSEKEPEFLSAFKRLKPVAPPSDPKLLPEKLEPPSERIPTPLDSPLSLSSDLSPPPEEPHPPTFSTTASLHIEPPSLPSPDLTSEPNELAVTAGEDVDDTDSESGLIGSYDITPAPSTDSVKPPPKECSEESDEAYPHSPAHSSDEQSSPPESGQAPRAESPPVEARLALEAMADKLASSLVSPPINAAVQESLQVTIIDAVPQSLLQAQSIDRSAVEALLKEYRGVLPLVAEEDLPQLLAPEPASNPPPEFHDHNICLVPSQSSLKGETKPAKGRVGFSSEAVGAYTYVAADDSSEDETEDGRDWSQGVHIDHLQYENLVLEHKIMKAEKKLAQVKARKEKEAEWASLNRWVEESTTAVSGGGGAGPQLSSYVPAHLPSLEDSRSLAETEWDYRAGESSQAEAANPLPQSFSRSNAAADLLF